jgi:hypothetical protein
MENENFPLFLISQIARQRAYVDKKTLSVLLMIFQGSHMTRGKDNIQIEKSSNLKNKKYKTKIKTKY